MTGDLFGKSWNTYTAVRTDGNLTIFPGSGGHTWEEVHAYFLRILDEDRFGFLDLDFLQEMRASHRQLQPTNSITSASTRWLKPYIFGFYEYENTSDPTAEAERAIRALVSESIREGLGLREDFKITHQQDVATEGRVMRDTTELRIDQLYASLNFPRTAPLLTADMRLLERDDALEENWQALVSLFHMGLLGEEQRREVCYLIYRLGLIRLDLYDRAKALGIPAESNPDLTWK